MKLLEPISYYVEPIVIPEVKQMKLFGVTVRHAEPEIKVAGKTIIKPIHVRLINKNEMILGKKYYKKELDDYLLYGPFICEYNIDDPLDCWLSVDAIQKLK